METINDCYQDVCRHQIRLPTGDVCQVYPLWKAGTMSFAIKPLNDIIMIVILDHDNSRKCNQHLPWKSSKEGGPVLDMYLSTKDQQAIDSHNAATSCVLDLWGNLISSDPFGPDKSCRLHVVMVFSWILIMTWSVVVVMVVVVISIQLYAWLHDCISMRNDST